MATDRRPARTSARDTSASWPLADRVGLALCWGAGLLLCTVALAIIVFFAYQGLTELRPSLLFSRPTGDIDQSKAGGFLDPIIGTLMLTAVGVLIAVPVAVGVAIWLVDDGHVRAHQGGQGASLAQQVGDGFRIGVAGEDFMHGGAQPRDAAADRLALDLEGADQVVGNVGVRHRRHMGCGPGRCQSAQIAPKHQARIDFWAWMRFSASSQIRLLGPSMTASTTSSPRWAGRQCRKTASAWA